MRRNWTVAFAVGLVAMIAGFILGQQTVQVLPDGGSVTSCGSVFDSKVSAVYQHEATVNLGNVLLGAPYGESNAGAMCELALGQRENNVMWLLIPGGLLMFVAIVGLAAILWSERESGPGRLPKAKLLGRF
ncbi:hypothetical protein KOI35_03380 [Actinoplanes bogorensis]|uniref:Uncharacterized protein n=1 Tax=Paractinoplanes bogorensis TaxID=1610840 RepID=A0ABS5YGN6_9ACTN|nr:hypothetical protein [Actinoplanes bogorensis]MBU2662543.1 hypothetical protein [Actinoplanes bogorensis]